MQEVKRTHCACGCERALGGRDVGIRLCEESHEAGEQSTEGRDTDGSGGVAGLLRRRDVVRASSVGGRIASSTARHASRARRSDHGRVACRVGRDCWDRDDRNGAGGGHYSRDRALRDHALDDSGGGDDSRGLRGLVAGGGLDLA